MGGAITTPGPEGAQTYREIIDSVRLARRELQAALLALRNDQVHLDAFFNSGHIDGLSATIDRPISFYDSITATDRQPATHPSLESLKRKIDLLQIIIWILKSDFLRLHLLEPVVGARPMSYPSIIDDYGLKDQSIYTAFFYHLDMDAAGCALSARALRMPCTQWQVVSSSSYICSAGCAID